MAGLQLLQLWAADQLGRGLEWVYQALQPVVLLLESEQIAHAAGTKFIYDSVGLANKTEAHFSSSQKRNICSKE